MNYTAIPYYYRDADNYKASGTIFLEGPLSGDQIKSIKSKLDEGEYFIPEDLGLNIPELQDQLSSFPSQADHVWHTLALYEISNENKLDEGEVAIPVANFVKAFAQIESKDSWDVEGAKLRLGLEDDSESEPGMQP